jgi:hypothetical protein
MNQEKNGIDKFIEGFNEGSKKKVVYERVYVRPTKIKSILGFIASLIFLVILVGLLTFNVMYFVLLIGNIIILIYFSINTFTEKGIGLPKTIAIPVEEEEEEIEEEPSYFEEDYQEEDEYYDDEERQ